MTAIAKKNYKSVVITLPNGFKRKAQKYSNGVVRFTCKIRNKMVNIPGKLVRGMFVANDASYTKHLTNLKVYRETVK